MSPVPASAAAPDPAPRPDAVHLLGIRIDCIRLPQLLERVRSAVHARSPITVLYVNVHCMNMAAEDRAYADILRRANVVYCDGTGVRLGARLAGLDIPERMTGADWIADLCRFSVRHELSLYFLGGNPGAAEEAADALVCRHPGLRVVGTASGFDVGPDTTADIRRTRPDILLVGMGTPRQEKWIAEHRLQLDAPVVWAVGALFDFVSGRLPRGPHWMTDHGLEWVCRLVVEPRKLWRRYLVGNPKFLWRVILTYRT